MNRLRIVAWLLVVLCCGLLFGCGGGGGGSQGDGTGTLQVALTDAQNPEFSEVVVAIHELWAVPVVEDAGAETAAVEAADAEDVAEDETEWILLASFDPPVQINVLDLAYQQELLADVEVPLGDYQQIRLVLAANPVGGAPLNYLVLADTPDSQVPIETPSGQQSGLKINGDYSVADDGTTVVVLDFDPNRAIHQDGGGDWIFRPTGIRMVRIQEVLPNYGALFGHALQEITDPASGETVTVPVPGAIVEVRDPASGEIVATTIVNPDDGSYRVFLPNGFYLVSISAEGMQPYDFAPQVFEVAEGEETLLVNIVLAPVEVEGDGAGENNDPPPLLDPSGEEPPVDQPPADEPAVEEPADEPAVELEPAVVRFWLADSQGAVAAGGSVTVSSVAMHTPGGWAEALDSELTLAIGEVPAEDALLVGELSVDAGKYTQLRVTVSDAVVNGEEGEVPVQVPSSALKLNRNMDICAGGEADIVVDLGAGKGLSYNPKKGTYKLQPVLGMAEITITCPEAPAPVQNPEPAPLPDPEPAAAPL